MQRNPRSIRFRKRYFRGFLQERFSQASVGGEERVSGCGEVDALQVEARVRRSVHQQAGGDVQGHEPLERADDSVPTGSN